MGPIIQQLVQPPSLCQPLCGRVLWSVHLLTCHSLASHSVQGYGPKHPSIDAFVYPGSGGTSDSRPPAAAASGAAAAVTADAAPPAAQAAALPGGAGTPALLPTEDYCRPRAVDMHYDSWLGQYGHGYAGE
jgi:hypothetical protein